MKITVSLFATFRVGRFREQQRDYPEGTRLLEVISDIGVREEEIGMVLINGRHAPLDQALRAGDSLACFPLLGGG